MRRERGARPELMPAYIALCAQAIVASGRTEVPRPHHDPELWNDDICFLLQEAEAALGLHAASLEPGSTIAPEELVERKIAAVFRANGGQLGNGRANGAVQRYRRAMGVWRALRSDRYRDTLAVYYGTTARLPHHHSMLGKFATVACWRYGADEALQKALRLGRRDACDPYAMKAERLVRQAHREWQRAARQIKAEWAEGNETT